MKRTLLFLLAFTSFAIALPAAPTSTRSRKHNSSKSEKKGGETLAQSANGWSYVKGEWVHPEGYKYVNGKILRTTARPGKAFPRPPGKLALENAEKLAPKAPAPDSRTEAEKAAEIRRKNLEPRPAPQTGTHL